MFLFACSFLEMRWIALLCLAILSPFRYGCSHVDSKVGHVSRSFLWHSAVVHMLCFHSKLLYFVFAMVCNFFSTTFAMHTFLNY